MGEFLALASVAVFLWALVGIIKPAAARLPNRGAAAAVFVASFLMLGIAGSMLPDPTTDNDGGGPYAEFPTASEWTLDDWSDATPEQRTAATDEFVSVLRARIRSTPQPGDGASMQACIDGHAEEGPSRVPAPEYAMACVGELGWTFTGWPSTNTLPDRLDGTSTLAAWQEASPEERAVAAEVIVSIIRKHVAEPPPDGVVQMRACLDATASELGDRAGDGIGASDLTLADSASACAVLLGW